MLLLISLLVFSTSPAFALENSINTIDTIDNQNINSVFNDAVKNYNNGKYSKDVRNVNLTNSSGKCFHVKLFKYNEKYNSKNNEYSETYVLSTEKQYVSTDNTLSKDSFTTASFNILRNKSIYSSNKGFKLAALSDEEWDPSISVKAYLTLTYDKNLSGKYLLTKVSGGWYKADSSVSISNRYVLMACQDPYALSQRLVKTPTSNTFSYNTGFTKYVNSDLTPACLQVYTTTKLTHSTSVWYLDFFLAKFSNCVDIGPGEGH